MNIEQIRDFVVSLEREFPVDQWRINGISIWPYVRKRVFFSLFYKLGENGDAKHNRIKRKNNFLKKSLSKGISYFGFIKNLIELFFFYFHLSPKKYVFLAYDDHRIDFKGKRFNRFFDSFVELKNINEYLYFEAGEKNEDVYKREHVSFISQHINTFIRLKKIQLLFRKTKPKVICSDYERFCEFLKRKSLSDNLIDELNISRVESYFKDFSYGVSFMTKVLSKVRPNKIISLCYYYRDFEMVNVAANRIGIETIDYQHGPSNKYHLMYGSWSKVPENGYEALPKTFWCWEIESAKSIDEWGKVSNTNSSEVVGNFWIEYCKSIKSTFEETNFILYTLQPFPITIHQLFPQQLIDIIKESDELWFCRMHPRQHAEKDAIRALLLKNGILEKVNIDLASSVSLPILLMNCKFHVTHSSGASIEADILNVNTVFINEIAKSYHPKLIEKKGNIFIPYSSEYFGEMFNRFSNNFSVKNSPLI